jgi:hypothetical protein
MTEINEFETEFVRRTQNLLTDYRGEYKLSNAINCMLGLIIFPNETLEHSHNPIWDIPIAEIQELNYLQIRLFEPVRRKNGDEIEFFQKTLRVLLKKVRNGLAHQNINPVNENGLFTGVVIKNYYGGSRRNIDLEIEFNRDELENFALFIAGKYLDD